MKSLIAVRIFVFCAALLFAWNASADSLGPSSRRTGWVVSEVMYNPLARADGKNLEFIEIHNSEPWVEDLSGFRVAGEVEFVFPANTIVPAGGFVVVAADPSALAAEASLPQVALGPFTGRMANEGGRIELWSRSGALLLEIDYNDRHPWPVAADGGGHSLVLHRPTFGENSPKAWAASVVIGGSPGRAEPTPAPGSDALVINEVLAHTDDPQPDYVELFNRSASAISLAGLVLTDDPAVDRFVIGNVNIPARGYVSFTQAELGFALSAAGEALFLKVGSRVADAVRFGAQENGVAWGRFPNGANEFYRLNALTPAAANAPIRISPVVINELMYHPISGDDDDQFIELHNTSAAEVDISGWRLEGGVEFVFPTGTRISAGGYLVVGRNRERLVQNHPTLPAAAILGNYTGRLAHSGERVALSMPEEIVTVDPTTGATTTELVYIDLDEVTYADGGRWGEWADGGGSSLELIDPRANHRLASNWADSDETAKAPWTHIETTAMLDNGLTGAPDRFQMILQDAGECLVDNVEALTGGSPANLVANGTFATDASGWTFIGNHSTSSWEASEGFDGPGSFHIRATGRGDTGPDRIQHALSTTMTPGQTGTLRAKARWLRGSPELLLRVRGNHIEAIGTLNVPRNLGTPGARNSRALANAAPGIYDVKHSPILPAAAQAIIVTARVEDPDAPTPVTLVYRLDPATTETSVAMNDGGVGDDAVANDGVFTARIPGQTAGRIVAFHVRATDARSQSATFPTDAPIRECLVRVGEVQPTGSLATYRMWMTAATVNRWSSRNKLDNSNLDVTFVYGNERVVYNVGARYAGSPYISGGYSGPAGNLCGYTGEFPKDDRFLGSTDLVLDWPGRDPTAIAESISYWIADEMDLPNSRRRFIRLHVNGVTETTRGSIYEDVQQPNGDFVEQWSPDDTEGKFYKIERAFEFSDTIGLLADPQPRLQNYTTTGGAKKLARYRWNWLARAVNGSPNDYDDLFALVDAVNAPGPEPYTSQTLALADIDEMMGIFAVEQIINNFDSWGHAIGKNMYAYKPTGGRWMTFMFDNDWLMDASSQHGYSATTPLFWRCEDPTVQRMFNHPPFRRAFYQQIKKAVDGPLAAEKLNPRADAMNAALAANNVTRSAGTTRTDATAVKRFLGDRRAFLITQLDAVAAPFAITSNGGADFETTSNIITLTGTAPIELKAILVNGTSYPLTWTDLTTWSMRAPLFAVNNALNLQGVDYNGVVIASATDTINVTFRGTVDAPAGKLVFSEIMYNPATPGGAFVELQNISTTTTFDLSNWRVEGIDFVFPQGTLIAPGGFVVVAKDRAVFLSLYGNNVPLAGEFLGNLRNDSETLWLLNPAGEVVDEVTYSDQLPWPALADGQGASLQLIDPRQDNTRAANWIAVEPVVNNAPRETLVSMTAPWRYEQSGADLGSAWFATDYNDASWPSGNALLYVETAAVPAAKNTPLTIGRPTYYFRGRFNFSGDPTKVFLNLSTIVDDGVIVYLNGRELYRIGMPDGAVPYSGFASRLVDNALLEGPFALPSTLLRQGENVIAAEVHQANGTSGDVVFGLSLATEPVVTPASTPGLANSGARELPAFPNLWINELEPVNLSGPTDEFGQRDPWVELHNAGSTAISLNGWHLTDSAAALTKWAFPSSARIEPGQFLTVWLDAQPAADPATQLHANFRAAAGTGFLALVGPFDGANRILDYATYASLPNDRSFGRFPDGAGGASQLFHISTPGAPNNNSAPALPLFINEWMASNQTIADPSDGDFDDWFEIYNPNDAAVDLFGYFLTDNIADSRSRWRIPISVVVPARGYVLIWADEENPLNPTELHANLKLDRAGETIGLYAPNGSLVDSITFGAQTSNVSQGRYPDGGEELRFFTTATPRASNLGQTAEDLRISGATLDAAGNVTIRWASQPGLTYRVQFKQTLGAGAWSDLTDVTATASATEIVDTPPAGTAQRFYRVVLGAP